MINSIFLSYDTPKLAAENLTQPARASRDGAVEDNSNANVGDNAPPLVSFARRPIDRLPPAARRKLDALVLVRDDARAILRHHANMLDELREERLAAERNKRRVENAECGIPSGGRGGVGGLRRRDRKMNKVIANANEVVEARKLKLKHSGRSFSVLRIGCERSGMTA